MKLIGSTTSPYVRRVRLLLEGYEYEFEKLKALSPEGGEILKTYSPIKRIPILIVGDKTLFDSTIISEYLLEKREISLSIDEKLGLRMIDELCDSCVTLFQQKLWNIDPEWRDERSKRMFERSWLIFNELEKTVGDLSELQKDWLFCVLDWVSFRTILEWRANHSKLESFYLNAQSNEKYKNTSLSL